MVFALPHCLQGLFPILGTGEEASSQFQTLDQCHDPGVKEKKWDLYSIQLSVLNYLSATGLYLLSDGI